ncbi:hypothetical protein DSO57_1030823 [Entomophthora muscae]|uniref:Uncharacterized protein n=1 Tax=Entomophthora muscae TaxID=34485 RepID=A0ACC2SQ93_9FUNG|nr:hypothetical protein DSO57_1030823 [Entomophthora muscae]
MVDQVVAIWDLLLIKGDPGLVDPKKDPVQVFDVGAYSEEEKIPKFPDLPANVSYNTQGALNESPLDVSNSMD